MTLIVQDFFTIQEYGFYDINFDNFGIWLKSVCEGSSTKNEVWIILK